MVKPKSILVLTTEGLNQHVGGLGTYIQELRKRLESYTHLKVVFHEIPFDGRYLECKEHDRAFGRMLLSADLIHANDYFTGYAALLRRPDARMVTTVHMLHQRFSYEAPSHDFELNQRMIAFIENSVLHRSCALIAVSRFIKKEIQDLNITVPSIDVIHNGVSDLFLTHPRPPRAKTVRLGFCGRLIHQKGSDLLPLLIAELKKISRPWTLDIVGDGHHKRQLTTAIAELGLGDRCRLHGWVPHGELPAMMASWDATLSLTQYEPFGLAPLESLATGTPVIGSVVGGMREFCRAGVNVIAETGQNLAVLVERLRHYMMGARLDPADVRCSVAFFDWNRTASATGSIYEKL